MIKEKRRNEYMELSYKLETEKREKVTFDSLLGEREKVIVFVRHLG
ncbi:hypothetical protein SAMN04488053_11810 [Alkalicoccus daliensis]|uniref:Uncharacterized protein n=1 Tax=Alkalicoccus daliensis TaxID=745820 RepID=A0A1H0KIE8_9BACI|nr:hypothetical protein SAMN04488053_11810 [Alkalicoccus daliensis]